MLCEATLLLAQSTPVKSGPPPARGTAPAGGARYSACLSCEQLQAETLFSTAVLPAMATQQVVARSNYRQKAKLEVFYTGGAARLSGDGKLVACACADEVKVSRGGGLAAPVLLACAYAGRAGAWPDPMHMPLLWATGGGRGERGGRQDVCRGE